ncbi:hypothetical protein Tcan_16279, partial [Toxocara canis]
KIVGSLNVNMNQAKLTISKSLALLSSFRIAPARRTSGMNKAMLSRSKNLASRLREERTLRMNEALLTINKGTELLSPSRISPARRTSVRECQHNEKGMNKRNGCRSSSDFANSNRRRHLDSRQHINA